jgi:hypothetical protein
MRTTSYSEVSTWLSCPREHYYSYGLKIAPLYIAEPLERGILGHAALEAFYRALMVDIPHDEAVALAFKKLGEVNAASQAYAPMKLMAEMATLLNDYFTTFKDEDITVLAVETEYKVGLLADYELPVRIDVIWRDNRKRQTYAVDHKFLKDFMSEEKMQLSPQLKLYLAGMWQKNDIQVDGIMYNELRTRTTIDNKADPSLKFVRTIVPFTEVSVKRQLEEHLMAGNRIAAWRKMPLEEWESKVLRSTRNCNMCPFQKLCVRDLNGEDTTLMKEFEFKPRTQRHELPS